MSRAAEAGDSPEVGDSDGDTIPTDPDEPGTDPDDVPGVPATPRNRAKSAVLWGFVGGFAFLVLAQGYLLLGGALPFPYAWLFAVAAAIAAGSSALTYVTEHRVAKRRT